MENAADGDSGWGGSNRGDIQSPWREGTPNRCDSHCRSSNTVYRECQGGVLHLNRPHWEADRKQGGFGVEAHVLPAWCWCTVTAKRIRRQCEFWIGCWYG